MEKPRPATDRHASSPRSVLVAAGWEAAGMEDIYRHLPRRREKPTWWPFCSVSSQSSSPRSEPGSKTGGDRVRPGAGLGGAYLRDPHGMSGGPASSMGGLVSWVPSTCILPQKHHPAGTISYSVLFGSSHTDTCTQVHRREGAGRSSFHLSPPPFPGAPTIPEVLQAQCRRQHIGLSS